MNTERDNWPNATDQDATDEELRLVHAISGPRPDYITPEQWRQNMRACAINIRAHLIEQTQPHALAFKIGDRDYFVKRDDRRGNAWVIIANGDIVQSISTHHYGEIGAFHLIGNVLLDIESRWAETQKAV